MILVGICEAQSQSVTICCTGTHFCVPRKGDKHYTLLEEERVEDGPRSGHACEALQIFRNYGLMLPGLCTRIKVHW